MNPSSMEMNNVYPPLMNPDGSIADVQTAGDSNNLVSSMNSRPLNPNSFLHSSQRRQLSDEQMDSMHFPISSEADVVPELTDPESSADEKMITEPVNNPMLNHYHFSSSSLNRSQIFTTFFNDPIRNFASDKQFVQNQRGVDSIETATIPYFPIRQPRSNLPSFDELDLSRNIDLDLSFLIRKFEYAQLFNSHVKMNGKIRALASLLKYELEEDSNYFLLRNNDVVIQICVDHDNTLSTCFTSWYGAQLRVNEKLRILVSQNRWITILRCLRVLNQIIPNCVPMHERVNCLNGLLVLEHDLTTLFAENKLALEIYGKENVEVYRLRTDLTPYTIALHWETYKSRFSVAINDVTHKETTPNSPLLAYLSVVYNEYMTLFPSSSCLNSNYEWTELINGIYTPGKYCLSFSRPIIVRRSMMKEILDADGVAVYTVRPINWFKEMADEQDVKNAVVFGFTSKKQRGACHRYLFDESMLKSSDDFLVKRITFSSPKTIVGLLTKLRKQASFTGLIQNLLLQAKSRRRLSYKERLVVMISSHTATSLTIDFNQNNIALGMLNLDVKANGFEIQINLGSGKFVAKETVIAWERLLMETWSLPRLMHRILLDLSAAKLLEPIVSLQNDNLVCRIAQQTMPFSKFSFLRDAFDIKSKHPVNSSRFDFSHPFVDPTTNLNNRQVEHSTHNSTNQTTKKRLNGFLQICPKRSWLLGDYQLHRRQLIRLRRATIFNSVRMTVARRHALTKTLYSTRSPVSVSNKNNRSRIPPLGLASKTPTILPSAAKRQRDQLKDKYAKKRQKLKSCVKANSQDVKTMENEGAWWSSEASTSNNTDQLPRETERTVKKPRILRSSSSTPATRSEVDDEVDDIMSSALKKPQPGKMVRLNATTAPTPTVSGSHTPNPNAQPAKSILSNPATRTNRLTKKTSFANSQRQFGLSTNPMNRLNSAKKIRLLNRKNRRFFGLLRGWHKLYSRIFRRARQSPVVVSSFIKNSTLENQKGSLLSMQGERASDVDSRLLFNSFSADFSNNPQRPTNLLGFSSVNHHFNNSIPRPSLGKALDNQMLMDGRRDDMQAIDQRVHGNQHLMDLNASDLAARRMERNLGTSSRPLGIETEMSMDIDGFEDEDESSADEETDPPPPPKENQQRFSRASIRRMRENAAREKRQLENNKKIAERKKEMEQQEQEFAQRHQIAARQPRPIHPKAPMKDLSRMASFESKSTLDGAEDFKSLHELPKLSRHGSDLKSNEITKTAERRVGRAPTASKEDYIRDMNAFSRNRSTSSSSSSSNSSSCSSSSTTPIFDKNDDSRTSESNSKRPRKSQRSTGVAMNLNGDSNSSNADSEKRRKSSTTQNSLTDTNANQMFQRNFSATRKSSIYKSKSDSSESSSSDDDEDSSSTSSSTSPPPLPARLSRQESIGVEIQQDEESRLSGKSTSSIPPPPVLAPHEPIRGSADVGMPLFDHTGSRKSSTSTQSDTANARSFAYGTQKIGQKDARNTDIFGKSDKEKSGTKTKTTTKGSDLLVRKEKKDKSKERSRLTDDDEKSKEKTTEKNKDPERLKEKLRSKDKGRELTETEKSNLKKDKPKEKSKEKPKDKSLKSRESPQPRAATSSTELNDATAERKSKRKRELSEMSPSLVGKPKLSGSKEFEKATQPPKIQKSLSKERERVKEPGMSRAKDAKPLKIKTVKDVKLFTKEISPPPLQQQSRKRSPSGRKKEKDETTSFAKKPRISEVEPKYTTTVDKTSARLKPARTDEVRALKRPLPTTSQVNPTDEKRRKLRKIEKTTDKLKDPDTPTRKDPKKSTPALPDIPEFTGRSSLSNLKNFRIPKVVDTEAAKNAEKEKEREKEVPVEKELEPTVDRRKEKERDKDVRENSRDRWERTERREFYPTEGYNDRRDSYYDRRVEATSGFYQTEPTTPRENYPSARGGNFHYGRGNYHAASHHNLPSMAATGYSSQRPSGLTGAFASHTGQSYSMHGDNPTSSLYQSGNERGVSHFRRPPMTRGGRASNFGANPMRKPVPDQIASPPQSYPSNQRTPQYRDPSMTTPTNWVNYQGGPQVKERPGPTPPYHNNAPPQSTYQPISNERFDARDRDYRPYRDRNGGVLDSSGHSLPTGIDSSPTDGLQIDEET